MIFSNIAKLFSNKKQNTFSYAAVGKSDVGKVRTNNEDNFVICEDSQLFVVCDGMGGHSCGEVASKIAVDTMVEKVSQQCTLQDAVISAHNEISKLEPLAGESGGKPGSTIVALKFTGTSWQLAWVGDSRIWQLRKEQLQQLTIDHTVVQKMVNWGDLTPEEAMTHPERNRLSQVLGQVENVPVVGLLEGKLEAGMMFLLASDGMTHWDETDRLQEILLSHQLHSAVKNLISLSLEAGGHDNVTCIVVKVV